MARNRSQSRRPARTPRSSRWAPVGYLLLIAVLLLIWAATTQQPWLGRAWQRVKTIGHPRPSPSATQREASAVPQGCGGDRWRIRVLADRAGAATAQATPQSATIPELVAMARPARLEDDQRTAAETHVYRVEGQLLRFREVPGVDLELVVAAPNDPSATLLAEIPEGRCVPDANQAALFDELREDFTLQFGPASSTYRPPRSPVTLELTGVGFFDPNGFALSPLLDLRAR